VLLFASEEPLSVKALYDLLIAPDEQLDKKAEKADKTSNKTPSAAKRNGKHEATNGTNGHHTANDNNNDSDNDIASDEGATVRISTLAVEMPEGFSEQLSDDLAKLAVRTPVEEFAQPIQGLVLWQESTERVFRIVEVAIAGTSGYQFATKPEFGELLSRLVKSKSKRRLSKAALETLAIIAYRQPVSKPEIEVIRGVSSNEVINKLLEKNLVTITGRSESVGKPLLYGTTDDFLRLFGLHNLADLPKPRELEELMQDRADILESMQSPAADGDGDGDAEEES
jgi:segregation and condensation protein B